MNRLLLLNIAFIFLIGCSVGPDYTRPDVNVSATFKELKGWREAQPRDQEIGTRWWEVFGDPVLNSLEEQVTISNQSIALAESQYRESLAVIRQERAGYFPTIGAGASFARSAGPSGSNISAENEHRLSLSTSWELDVWGKVRRQVEAGTASADASFADLQAMRLSMQAQLAKNYFQLRIIDAQRKNLEEAAIAYSKALELTQNRYQAGVASKSDVVQAQTQLKSVQAQAIDTGVQRAQLEHALALLIGKPPADFSLEVAEFKLPQIKIPVALPSDLLERRPDIASAERKMAAANAKIGVAKAAYYPSFSLGGSLGYQNANLVNLFTTPNFFWSLGPLSMAATLFDGGARQAVTEQAMATYDGTVASYRQTVLNGLQEVEDSLAALRILDEEAQIQEQAVIAAHESLVLTTNQYKAGIVNYLNVITAQTISLTNEKTAIGISGQRLSAATMLIKALGGGWNTQENKKDGQNSSKK